MRRPNNVGVFDTADGLTEWLARFKRGPLAVDTETTGLNSRTDRVGSLCMAAGDSTIYACRDALGPAVRWLADEVKASRELVFHNAKFDLHMLRDTFGLSVPYIVHDTLIESFLIDNRGAPVTGAGYHVGHGLKNLAAYYVDEDAHEAEKKMLAAVKEAGGKGKGDILAAPMSIVAEYGGLDPWYTLELHRQFREVMQAWQQPSDDDWEYPPLTELYETERWFLRALVDMEERGIIADPAFFAPWRDQLAIELTDCKAKLAKFAGRDLNWNSTPQLRKLLYEDLGLNTERRTKSKQKATDEIALLNINHPIGAELLRYRDLTKQHGTYAQGLFNAVQSDGAIHCTIKQTGADTGRTSCEEPNLQQVPRKSGARKGFKPRPGLVLRFADYSQIEMRFAAHVANDETLVNGFCTGGVDFDTHQATARKMFGVPEPTEEQRKYAKIMNFLMLFGGGEDKATSQLVSLVPWPDAIRACKQLKHHIEPGLTPHRALAQKLRELYFSEFKSIKKAAYRASDAAEYRGYTMNRFGRHRFLDDKFYKALNSDVQGSAGDQAKKGLVNVYREMQLNQGAIALMLIIHDELVYESEGDPEIDRQVIELMQDTTTFRVPILADMSGSSTNWQEKVKIKISPKKKRRAA
jgi:DNA polymerase-1